LFSQWANDWVRYQTDGKGNYVTTGMEDTGTLQALTFLAKAGRVDINRVLVLRTASDYDQPATGETAAASLARNSGLKYSGLMSAIDSAWRVGRVVMQELVHNWARYRDSPPALKP
jgi:purine nucleoside permease